MFEGEIKEDCLIRDKTRGGLVGKDRPGDLTEDIEDFLEKGQVYSIVI